MCHTMPARSNEALLPSRFSFLRDHSGRMQGKGSERHCVDRACTHTYLLLLNREPTPPAGPPPRSFSIGTCRRRCALGRRATIPPAVVLRRCVHTCVLKGWPLHPRGMRCPHCAHRACPPMRRHAWDPRHDACVPSEEGMPSTARALTAHSHTVGSRRAPPPLPALSPPRGAGGVRAPRPPGPYTHPRFQDVFSSRTTNSMELY